MLENLEVIIDDNKLYLYDDQLFYSEDLDKGIDTTRNAESLIKVGYNSDKDLIFYEKIRTFFTDKNVEEKYSFENYNWNVLFKIERDELVKYEKEEPGFDNFLKKFKEKIKINYDYIISNGLIHYIKEPNYCFKDINLMDMPFIKLNPSRNHKYDGPIFTASHEFEVVIQNRGLRYTKEFKRNE